MSNLVWLIGVGKYLKRFAITGHHTQRRINHNETRTGHRSVHRLPFFEANAKIREAPQTS